MNGGAACTLSSSNHVFDIYSYRNTRRVLEILIPSHVLKALPILINNFLYLNIYMISRDGHENVRNATILFRLPLLVANYCLTYARIPLLLIVMGRRYCPAPMI